MQMPEHLAFRFTRRKKAVGRRVVAVAWFPISVVCMLTDEIDFWLDIRMQLFRRETADTSCPALIRRAEAETEIP